MSVNDIKFWKQFLENIVETEVDGIPQNCAETKMYKWEDGAVNYFFENHLALKIKASK